VSRGLASTQNEVIILEKQQKLQTQHVHAPQHLIEEQLGTEDADVFHNIIRRQVFNWLPEEQTTVKLEKVLIQDRGDQGIVWNIKMKSDEDFILKGTHDDYQLRASEVETALGTWAEVLA
jgi:hypothetical protein